MTSEQDQEDEKEGIPSLESSIIHLVKCMCDMAMTVIKDEVMLYHIEISSSLVKGKGERSSSE